MMKHGKREAEFVTALLTGPLIEALERYQIEELPGKSRSDALKLAFKEWCIGRGYVDKDDPQA
jgi:hypothetical protein